MNTADASNLYEDIFINNRLVNLQHSVDYLFVKARTIFAYDGLPDTMPQRVLEKYLTENGFAVVYEYDGELFCSSAAPSGGEDVYGDPLDVRINHIDRQKDINKTLDLTIGVDAVLVRSDYSQIGLQPIIFEFAAMIAQAKITTLRNFVDLRGNYIIQAKDERSYQSALAYEQAIRAGDTAIILAEEFDQMEGLTVHSTPISNNPATQTIELFQFINAYYYSELGVNLNNNMKKQYVNESEVDTSAGMPLVDNMLSCREEAYAEIKRIFGVEITLELASEWKEQDEEAGADPLTGDPATEADPDADDPEGNGVATEEANDEAGESDPTSQQEVQHRDEESVDSESDGK